ncbi:MAG: hypothetical protein QW227_01165 [Candidatus Aenigmatarchaeota archaeon]|nr:hypothetical protein [Candidatus Aenigmarchaeota archaeon]
MARIEIRKGNTAILISFDTDANRFESPAERTKFFTELHGRRQIIIKAGKRYEYQRPGLLDTIPHIPVDNSVFIIAQEHLRQMEAFMREWEDKVVFKMFPVLLKQQELRRLERRMIE